MEQSINALRGLRYQLRMGILISGPSYIYGDNMSVVHNTSRPESVLRKKSNSVCYHTVSELVAIEKSLVGHITSKENVTDLMTKVFYGKKQKYLVINIFYDIYEDHQLSVLVSIDHNCKSLIPLVMESNLKGLEICSHI